jgi:hypothetical protein
MRTFTTVSVAAALLTAAFVTPVFAQAAEQEPGMVAFYQSLGAGGSGAGPDPVYRSHSSSYGAMNYYNGPVGPEGSCGISRHGHQQRCQSDGDFR